jgi:uncharacterized protein YlxP (DUF503 family)
MIFIVSIQIRLECKKNVKEKKSLQKYVVESDSKKYLVCALEEDVLEIFI